MQKWLEQFRNQFAARTSAAHRAALHAAPAPPPPPPDTGPPATGAGLTREHVLWAYRLLLGRELDDEQVVQEWLRACTTVRELRTHILSSAEYQAHNRDMPLVQRSTPAIVEVPDGCGGTFRLHVNLFDAMVGLGIVRGQYEPNETAFVQATVRPGWNILDIGANIGYFSMLCATLAGADGHVYAFEPMHLNAAMLARSIAENGYAERITLNEAAAGTTTGTVQITYLEQQVNSGGVHLVPTGGSGYAGHAVASVPMIVLDQLELRRPIQFVKIDIEGAEPLALRGARTLLQQDQPLIMSEVHAELLGRIGGVSVAAYLAELEQLGYASHLLADGQIGPQIT
ncbi:MAG: FkbM family methyltransferase, partial [Chloroflexaceae bacterium]|nr:FkbM family methyltransferase [Chloroflexaceae bacterium]